MNIDILIDKIRANEPLTRDELQWALAWLLSDEGKVEFDEEINRRWAGFESTEQYDYTGVLHKIHQQMDALPRKEKRTRASKIYYWRYVLEVAAAVVIVFGISLFIQKRTGAPDFSNQKALEEQVEIYNPKGLRTTIMLPDSSKVILNADSKIEYAHKMQGPTRIVRLEGEAYFEVAKDSLRPFIVETNSAKMTVLGTCFNVRSYPEDQYVETTLVEGSLAIDAGKKKSLLEPGKQISIHKTSQKSDIYTVNTQKATGWKEGKIYFQSQTFDHIATVLERVFNVNIEVRNQNLSQKKFTGKFENGENLEQVLQVLKLSSSFVDVYDKETNTILIN